MMVYRMMLFFLRITLNSFPATVSEVSRFIPASPSRA